MLSTAVTLRSADHGSTVSVFLCAAQSGFLHYREFVSKSLVIGEVKPGKKKKKGFPKIEQLETNLTRDPTEDFCFRDNVTSPTCLG